MTLDLRRLTAAVLVWFVLTVLLIVVPDRLRINTTHSVPPGLYAVVSRPLTYDTFVVTCLDPETTLYGLERAYLHPGDCPGGGRPVLKQVAALPGDTVTVTTSSLSTDRLELPRSEHDLLGRPVRQIRPGTYAVSPGTVWLYSDYSRRSWDSRYWGPVPIEHLRTAVPLWLFP